MSPHRARNRWGYVAVAVTTVVTAAVRLQHLTLLELGPAQGAATLSGRWAVASGDSAYHVRRMAWVSQHGVALLQDPWTHSPAGNLVVWPDGLDSLGGWLASFLGAPGDLNAAIWAGISLVTLLAAATAGLTAGVALRQTGRSPLAAMAGGLLIALHPGLHNYTQAGKIDHHAAEPLLTFGALAALLAAASSDGQRSRRIYQGIAVFCVVAALVTWPSSALTVALLGGLAGVYVLLAPAEHRAVVARRLAWPLATAGLLALPLGLHSPFGHGGAAVAYALSALQPGLLLVSAFALVAASQVRGGRVPGRLRAAAVMMGSFALGLVVWSPGRLALLGGGEFVSGRGFVVLIQESMSAWETGLSSTLSTLSVPLLALPLLGWHGWRSGDDPERRVWVVAALVTAVLALTQIRFAPLAAVPLAVLAAAALADLAVQRDARWSLTALVIMVLPGALEIQDRRPPIGKRVAVWQALQWLKERDPPRQNASQLAAQPDSTVLASWSYGHDLLTFGGRANVCSPLIAPGQEQGLRACLQLALGTLPPQETEQLLEGHRVRWWLTTPWSMAAMRAYAEALGLSADTYAAQGAEGAVVLTRAGQCTPGQQLWFANGSAAPDGSCRALPTWRLAYAAPSGGAKLFERVRGAKVRILGCPAALPVRLVARLADARQGWLWMAQAERQSDGTAVVSTPWSTGFLSQNIRLLDQRLECGSRSEALAVSERAVQLGLSVDATAPAQP